MAEDFSFRRQWLDGIITNDDLSPKEKAQQIMSGHITITDGLKDERDSYKKQAEEQSTKAADLQKQLESVTGGEDFKKKYEDEHKAFEDFKAKAASDAETAKVKAAYRKLLAEEGISEKRLDSIIRVTDFSKMKMDKDGNLDGVDELKKAIADDWGVFKTTVTNHGAKVEKPPQVGKATKTKEEILAIKDDQERLAAIAENHEMFGI